MDKQLREQLTFMKNQIRVLSLLIVPNLKSRIKKLELESLKAKSRGK